MVRVICIDTSKYAQIICMPSQIRQQLAHFKTRLSVLAVLKWTFQQPACLPFRSENDFVRALPGELIEFWFRVKEISLEGPAVHKQLNHAFHLRWMVNDGIMPTRTAMARANRAIRPIVVRFEVDRARLLEGRGVDRIDGLEGRGGRAMFEWVYRVDDGPTRIVIDDPVSGTRSIEITDQGSALNGGDR